MFGWYYDPTMLLILPALLLAIWAQVRVNSTFHKYSQVPSLRGWTAAQLAEDLLAKNGINDVRVEHVRGSLTDHYASTSIAALGIAAHECGHAIQDAEGYAPLRTRQNVAPIAQLGSFAAVPLFVLGLLMSWRPLLLAGIAVFTLVVAFYLITLPVEYNASNRALAALESGGYLDWQETDGARKVLRAAGLTYVAAALQAILQLLRLLLIFGGRQHRD